MRVVEAGSAASGHGAAFVSPHCGSLVIEAARQLPRQALKTQCRAHTLCLRVENAVGLRTLRVARDGSGSGSVRVSAGFGFSGFGFWFPPVDIQWISEINYLELKLMFYNMLMIICLLRLLNLLKVES